MTLAKLLGDPDNCELFNMNNVEEYKGYDIYDQDGSTFATKLMNGGVHCLNLKGTRNIHRQALKNAIDEL